MFTKGFIKKVGLIIGVGTGLIITVKSNDWKIQTIGLIRFGKCFITVAGIIIDYKRTLYSGDIDVSQPKYNDLVSEVHLRSAKKLLELCKENGGVFIKVGQHIGSIEYLVPEEYVKTMKVLHANAPISPLSDVLRVIKEDFKSEPKDIFDDFAEKPLGAASLAQVHKARLKNGTLVAVKVQHPRVKAHLFVDMKMMEVLAKIDFNFDWLVEEMKKNLPLELDFVHEGYNVERVTRMFSHFNWLKRVLTMEFCEGGQVDDITFMKKHKIDPNEVTHKLGELYANMIFVQGYVHCDPHPGNIIVSQNEKNKLRICLLDHGLYTILTDKFRLAYANLWLHMLNGNVNGIKKSAADLGVGNMYGLLACMVSGRSWETIQYGMSRKKYSNEEKNEIKQQVPTYIPLISVLLKSVPREMLLIFKTNDLLRGIEFSLGTRARMGSLITMMRSCVNAAYLDKQKNCSNVYCKAYYKMSQSWAQFRISAYQLYLWIRQLFSTHYLYIHT